MERGESSYSTVLIGLIVQEAEGQVEVDEGLFRFGQIIKLVGYQEEGYVRHTCL